MKLIRLAMMMALPVAVPVILAAPAQADPDTDFANELHVYGIYGPKDYNAWIGKITCKRLRNGLDKDAQAAGVFLRNNIERDSSTDQIYQFLGASIRYYCPDQTFVLERAATPAN